jgi:DNA-directed RNA polymerase specialized sigma24 family protein
VDSTHQNPAPSNFGPTRWTLVLRARGESSEAQKALGELCEAYYRPVFRFLRSEGREDDMARELTQEFFARLLSRSGFNTVEPGRGRFRSFLLGAVKHFLADVHDHEHRLKRGGGVAPESLDALASTETSACLEVPDSAVIPADEVFDREWALAVMEHGLTALEGELAANGKREQFDVLKPWLVGDTAGASQMEAAHRLGLSEGALKVAIHRLRKRFGELVKSEIAQTIGDPTAVHEELRYLVEVLSHPRVR